MLELQFSVKESILGWGGCCFALKAYDYARLGACHVPNDYARLGACHAPNDYAS